MERRKFTREFKLEAVRLVKDRGVSYVQASQDLNVHTSQLRRAILTPLIGVHPKGCTPPAAPTNVRYCG